MAPPDPNFPELPSDEELGITDLDLSEPDPGRPPTAAPAPPVPPPPSPPTKLVAVGPPPGGGGWSAAFVTAAALLVGVWFASPERLLPDPAPANAPDTVFSSARAMTHLVELARAPRPVGAPEHTRAREWTENRLRELDIEPSLHETLSTRRRPSGVETVHLRNILARIPGTDPTGAILLLAHYDGVPHSPAAGDDGTGVVVALEMLRALRGHAPLRNDLIVLISDGEEIGLLGADAFVREHPWMDDVAVVVNLEMRGGSGPAILFETGVENGWILDRVRAADRHTYAPSIATDVYRRLPNDTDFTPFRRRGIQGANFAAIGDGWIYHTPDDSPANISESTLQHMGAQALALVREVGHAELTAPHGPDRATIFVPGAGLMMWPANWAPLIALALAFLWLAAALLALRRGGRPGVGLLLGVGGALLLGAIGYGGGVGLLRLLPRFHPEFGYLLPLVYGEGWYLLAITAAVTGAALICFLGFRRAEGVLPLFTGAMLLPVGGAIAASFAAPLAAPALQVAAGAGLVALLLRGLMPVRIQGSAAGGWASLALVLIPALVVLIAMVPVIEMVMAGVSLRMAGALGVVIALSVIALLPGLEPLAYPNRIWAPGAAVLLAFLFFGGGVSLGGASEERPLLSTLIHFHDNSSGEAFLATRSDTGVDWATETTGVSWGPEGEVPGALAGFPISPSERLGRLRTAPAPAGVRGDFPLPEVDVTPLDPGTREGVIPDPQEAYPIRLQLRIRSRVGAEILHLRFPPEQVEILSVRGRSLASDTLQAVTSLRHQGPWNEGVELIVLLRPGIEPEQVQVEVLEEHLRPAELIGAEWFQRPAGLVLSVYGGSDRSWIRSVIPLAPSPVIVDDSAASAAQEVPPTPRDL